MRKILLLLVLFIAFALLVQRSVGQSYASCMTITGSVQLNSGQWPAGYGGLQLACAGDNPVGPSNCGGSSQTVGPGQSFSFSNCSCLAGECLSIATASVPPGCSFESSTNFCGVNGGTVQAPIKLNCPTPVTPCPGGAGMCGNPSGGATASCQYGANPGSWLPDQKYTDWCAARDGSRSYCFSQCNLAPTSTPTPSPTPTRPPVVTNPPVTYPPVTYPPVTNPPVTNPPVTNPPLACGADCSSNANKCQSIAGCNYCNPTSKKCEAPPQCGADCSSNPNICQNISGCNYCNPSGKTCTAQPTPTATSTPAPTSTPVPTATPTPTPFPFDNSMCTCDGLNFTPIILGTPVNVTAYGKVLGVNKNYAKIPSFTFSFYQSPPNSSKAKRIDSKQVNTTVIEDTAAFTRYQAIWALNLPSSLDQTQTYRIQAHPDCSRKAAVGFFDTASVVLGTSTKQLGFFDRIALFFVNLFGGNSTQNVAQVSGPTATPTLTAQQKKNLQLGTFTPAQNVTTGKDADNCTFVKFNF